MIPLRRKSIIKLLEELYYHQIKYYNNNMNFIEK